MIEESSADLSFHSEKDVEAYAKFFLSVNPIDSKHEFSSQEEIDDFNAQRERALKAQLDNLRRVNFDKPNATRIESGYFKLVKEGHTPLSSEGSSKGSSRFNYKEIGLLKNRAIYFGKTKKCCEIEKFHLDYQREQITKVFDKNYTLQEGEISFPKHFVKEYQVVIDNILVLSTKPSWDAIGIRPGAFMNEWYELNEEYEIPSSSQILGTIARIKGFKGILYRSIRYQIESSLVLFEENAGELQFREIDSQDYSPSQEIFVETGKTAEIAS